VNFQVGNGASIIAQAIGKFSLIMPIGKVLVLEDCYHVLNFVSNIISILCWIILVFVLFLAKVFTRFIIITIIPGCNSRKTC